ncbi:MAG: hypothetical protein A2W90_16175 [Bacteroidetes bacterium GWF2_42_66]|nr:MAG: hypothetical protein A2W92_08860 [Bacteroidetes bacterium GWA2_42_15]OFX96236.1 MAG: hypothetical protein A2W89_05105 [Bacteroidetes bacterium GWE2_42_39]OFY46275.1 MAG: hypothetical protein A2W90_16175 [Bacteroidetes bacterium GWF2_42_66]HAZ02601.1 hypothetical protein [Marinilabiliales bacterium]HBL78347.1 hypothetical protein [Prolixibacteraceae bacterium]
MKSIIRKYLSGNSSEEEKQNILNWMRKDGNLVDFQQEKVKWEMGAIREEMSLTSRESWNSLQNQLLQQTQQKLQRTLVYMRFFKYAAIILVLLSVSAAGFFAINNFSKSEKIITTIRAEKGQIANVVLPDSTEIWLNSGSILKYNNNFSLTNRDVELVGEAFFSVTKNKKLPMVVKGSKIEVKVLGTRFNVSAYPEDNLFNVTLEEGEIELMSSGSKNFSKFMSPGELASFDKKSNDLNIKTVNTDMYTSWKNGIINIYNLPLEEVIVKLSKRYNQKFEIDSELKSLRYTYVIKNEPLSEVLQIMETITPIKVSQEGDIIKLKYSEVRK